MYVSNNIDDQKKCWLSKLKLFTGSAKNIPHLLVFSEFIIFLYFKSTELPLL